jgi:transposase
VLGRSSPQTSIFDGDQQYLEHVGERNLYGFLARHRHELFCDEDFACLYSADNGRPSVPPSLLCTALVLQTYERCSDAEARDRAAFDLRWKVALGVADRDRPFAKSTLQLFRAQLLVHDKLRLPFERSLKLARRTGHLKSDGKLRAAVDTTNVLGRGAVKDTYNLLADGILSVMRVLAKAAGVPLDQWATSHELTRYLASSIKGEAAIDWNDRRAREALLGELVADAERVLELGRQARAGWSVGSLEDERLRRASDVLRQVLLQDIERDHDGGSRLHRGTSADRVCSVHDPEMRHGRKSASTRFDGHKLAVAADVESQFDHRRRGVAGERQGPDRQPRAGPAGCLEHRPGGGGGVGRLRLRERRQSRTLRGGRHPAAGQGARAASRRLLRQGGVQDRPGGDDLSLSGR